MNCKQCDESLTSYRQIESGKLLYACDNGHPNLVPIESVEQAREVAEILSQKSFDKMAAFDPHTNYSMKWITPTRLAHLANGEEFSYIDVGEEKGH